MWLLTRMRSARRLWPQRLLISGDKGMQPYILISIALLTIHCIHSHGICQDTSCTVMIKQGLELNNVHGADTPC